MLVIGDCILNEQSYLNVDFFVITIHKCMHCASCTFTLLYRYPLTARSIIHMGISFWTAIVRLNDVYVWFLNGKNNKRLLALSMQIPSGLRLMKKENDLFCLYTNQPAGYFCSYIRPPGRMNSIFFVHLISYLYQLSDKIKNQKSSSCFSNIVLPVNRYFAQYIGIK